MSETKAKPADTKLTVDGLVAENTALKEQVKELEAMVTDLNAEVRAQAATKGINTPLTTLRNGKSRVQVLCGALINGVRKSAAEIAADPDLCEQLVNKGSGIVKLVNA